MSVNRCLLVQAEVQAFIEHCMLAVGTRPSHARSLAEVLVEGDMRGHYSHGLNRLGEFTKRWSALKRKFSISSLSTLPVHDISCECTVGTNPISVAAPAKNGDSFVLDMATSAAALGKVELHHRNGISIPEGWGCDAEGCFSTDPKAVLSGGGLVPLGGSENTGGHKGYGLGLMVEVFCGILSGSQYSKNIRTWRMTDRRADLGQCFVAINPENFATGFNDRMADLLSMHRNLAPAEPGMPVLAPGDPERKHIQTCRDLGGIPYHLKVVNHMNELASTLGVSPLLPTHRLTE
ncbi:hypothetical protein AOLI_G00178520 [Acnodon oligacanthus]